MGLLNKAAPISGELHNCTGQSLTSPDPSRPRPIPPLPPKLCGSTAAVLLRSLLPLHLVASTGKYNNSEEEPSSCSIVLQSLPDFSFVFFCHPGPRLDMDPDIVAALDEDFDYDDPDNILDDDFIIQANSASRRAE